MPSEMIQEFGVKKINREKHETSSSKDKVPTINGEIPEYVATNPPVTVTETRKTSEWTRR
jgi:hypothetical protein